jgi:PKD repeat protein
MAFDFEISGLAVKFFDRTTFVASTWAWNFGDSTTSTIREPIHTYSAAGSYTVVLTVTCGSRTSSVSKTLHVTDLPTPESLAVSLSSPWLFGTEYGPSYTVDVVTNSPVAAIASGGAAPYSYLWQANSGFNFSTAGIFPSSPTAAATTFSAQLESPSSGFTGWVEAVCVVTDADGTQVTSSPVRVFLTASFDAFYLELSTEQLLKTGSGANQTTDPVSIAITGGSGNFSYQWNLMSDDVRVAIDTDTDDSTTITVTGLSAAETLLVAINLTVTDTDSGDVVISDWVQIIFTRTA